MKLSQGILATLTYYQFPTEENLVHVFVFLKKVVLSYVKKKPSLRLIAVVCQPLTLFCPLSNKVIAKA